ncbi:MAG: gamma-glutamylcyclotransferase, partial [Hyphomicrobiales bacterium]|nr:gamma-glutamylcyclotransferase [Hyphomicrobiales bacterium]
MADNCRNSDYFAYFGFGSLVNRKTLSNDTIDVIPAKLKGWRRHWQPRPDEAMASQMLRSIALLSVHQDPSCDITGLIIIDKTSNLNALDKRERGYQKINLTESDFVLENNDKKNFVDNSIHVYVSSPGEVAQEPLSLLRSYLDVVMQGYLREFGEDGIAAFIDSTKGFDLQILEDRQKPIYSRH